MPLHVVILAAGQGKRMFSTTPKVLHCIAGKPMLTRVIEVAQQLNPERIHVVYGHEGQRIKEALSHLEVNWVPQEQQLGTGHALWQALPFIASESQVLVLSGDVPLIQADTLKRLMACQIEAEADGLSLLVSTVDHPMGLGRILRDSRGAICAIVEEKDATVEQKTMKEIYTGICCANAADLARWLPALNNNNAQNEYYLTSIIALAQSEHYALQSVNAPNQYEIQGVNDKLQLHQLERYWQQHQAKKLLLEGVLIADIERIDIRGELHCGKDVFIDVNTVFHGTVVIGNESSIGPNCVLNNVTIGDQCEIFPNSVLENCDIGHGCHIGPFARLRPGTQLADQCKIGNFVETKNAVFGPFSKASHLSYLGDVTVGKNVNIGAGTITCNYDGANKHQTIIEEGAFIGSDTQLVAPVKVGAFATVGAGSTIRKDVPPGELTLTESKQKTITGWKRPVKSSI